jgi:hypothetical protein
MSEADYGDDFIEDETGEAEAEEADAYTDPDDSLSRRPISYRGASSDPTFGYLIALALAVGLAALPPEQRDLRYTILWLIPAGFGVLAWLLGNSARISEESPENLAWGVAFALIIATPLLAIGGSTLVAAVRVMFQGMSQGTLLAYLVFVMPTAETLFFRGVLQQERAFWIVGLMGSLWGAAVFLPTFDIARFPFIAVVIVLALAMMNMTYSYVRQRNGLAAAWLCQIIINLVLIFVPYVQ